MQLLTSHNDTINVFNRFLHLTNNTSISFVCTKQKHHGHSTSSDPAKLGFFIWPSPKFMKVYKSKRSHILSSTKLKFEIGSVFPKLWALEIFMLWKKLGQALFWNFAVGTLTDCPSATFLNTFIQYFAKEVQGFMLKQTWQKVLHWWPLNPS